ncbi:branched-chain amino acid ABC transporter permease [Pseudoroseomonas wenyumeiae]|uniref:Branched-chain amino acid ABC transporter permease n=1 Tax=Teichococcus wenyumeiae TaxID=2478470 RepID=A0A3A9JCM7_9PROT|nr:branched-chain amino acid ABC transporter permease [Pseudoroseomonas wenyumeiae]RKK01194.1 branched-chain amino acid ABC transporter permease [Pseudoroseomonas wenyumeiae]RMI27329.1 branched-chain amino acid ABC transporter permease [Pseudoroseomonas wenyumeiae]
MRDRLLLGLALLLAIALPWLAEAAGSPATVSLATRMAIYAIAAASLNLVLGYGGLVSFGHAAYFGLGGYAVGILYAHWRSEELLLGLIPGSIGLLPTLGAAMLLGGASAAVLGALSLRTRGVQFIMITLAFAQMLFFLFVSLKAYGGDDGLSIRRRGEFPGLDLRAPAQLYWLCLGLLVGWLLLLWRVTRSRFGQVLAGARQSERRMAALGVSVYPYRLVAFVISGMGTALAGGLMANALRFVSPDMMHWAKSGELMIMVILGGLGTLLGPVLGAIALVGLENWLSAWTEHWQFILGPILLAVVLFGRGGLMALLRRVLPA